ncbi:uncharacterized protein FIBRA_02927 [Fibroporia radiculosa]|uniref:Uncharacterized protein n=1 Tax=Fibroporia radiculosa TaxID=599839 RepID=J4I9B7_9APHY|nr:uncharacterized protein FIBRA_02927 [Fibroporia radiculosa]CCM00881.1 predicted protein [Fibroporia radiculosa]
MSSILLGEEQGDKVRAWRELLHLFELSSGDTQHGTATNHDALGVPLATIMRCQHLSSNPTSARRRRRHWGTAHILIRDKIIQLSSASCIFADSNALWDAFTDIACNAMQHADTLSRSSHPTIPPAVMSHNPNGKVYEALWPRSVQESTTAPYTRDDKMQHSLEEVRRFSTSSDDDTIAARACIEHVLN